MREAYNAELQKLHRDFFQVGRYVNEAIYKSIKAFTSHDKELAKEVINEDKKINQLHQELEQACIEIIALQGPVTTDLRKIVTILKASADLERMGDHAVSISKSTIRVEGTKRDQGIEQKISKAGEKIKVMGQDILDAFIEYDSGAAIQIAKRDDDIDELSEEIKQAAVDLMKKDPEIVLGATDYTLVSTYIERIGDYVTNIAEWIVYFNTGEITELNTHNHLADYES